MKWIRTEANLFVNLDYLREIFAIQNEEYEIFRVIGYYRFPGAIDEEKVILAIKKTEEEAVNYIENILKDYL